MPEDTNSGLNKNLVILHFTVFIWGFTSILGKLISISSVSLVWYRVLIALVSLFLYFKFSSKKIQTDGKLLIKLLFTGALVGGHWILFFQAIKVSTVPVTLVCLSSMTLFTAFLEPLFKDKKVSKSEILAGIMIIAGISIIFKFETRYTMGIVLGLLSAAFASLFGIINSQFVQKTEAPLISFYELLGAFFWVSIFMLITGNFTKKLLLNNHDVAYLMILGTVCTSLAYVAGVSVMREISAFKVALITNLEPVYGILLSFMFFGERDKMHLGFWIGALIILSTIFLFPIAQKQLTRYKSR